MEDAAPVTVLTDFEVGVINAFLGVFQNVTVPGCLFHFGQSIWRKLQCLRLSLIYNEEVEFSMKIRKIMALAFTPEDDVIDVFESM